MGTSSANSGPDGRTPLIPTWLNSGDGAPLSAADDTSPNGQAPDGGSPVPPAPTYRPPPPAPPYPGRFQNPRANLSRFARSDGSDRRSLGRAVSQYVSSASGGARNAARRMGASTKTASGLLGFLVDAQERGAREALRALNLERLAGSPIEEIFLGLADYVCPDGGSIDEGIAREAFIETIVDLSELGISNLDALLRLP
ncbi:MAG TPA: Qat anti-phage system associated protein QatB [Candidatus Paceibacterota bacterium]|nr:Qat anti-phage system associated protein QatB [Candidatus Paceibacterota bacterium]